jgi:hypothetical protein
MPFRAAPARAGLAAARACSWPHRLAGYSGFIYSAPFDIHRRVSDLTFILQQMERGDPQAADRLLPLVYDELRRIAAEKMAREPAGQTLQPTALVHEAWLRLGGDEQPTWQNRAHFFGAAAEAMRRILIDRARRRRAENSSPG